MRILCFSLIIYLLAVSVEAKKKRNSPILPCLNPQYTYSILLPPSYAKMKNKKFPTLFISSPSGKPSYMGLENWAEKNEVIIILNRTTQNGFEKDYSNAWHALMKTVESKYRIHPFLRFSTGFSGGGEASAHVAVDFSDKWSGVILQAHSGNNRNPPKHCAVAFLAGEQDFVHSIGAVRSAYSRMQAKGNPVHIKIYPSRGHRSALKEDVINELDWMLNLKRYNHPAIDSAYIKDITPEIEDKISEVLKIEDCKQKLIEIDILTKIPWIASMKEYPLLTKEYAKATIECVDQETIPLQGWITLIELSNSQLYKKLDRKTQASISLKIRTLEKNKNILKEKAAMTKYYRAYKWQQKYNKAKKKLKREYTRIEKEYNSILDRYPESVAAGKAQKALDDL